MIEVLSSWAKGLGLAIVIVSILEMILPNNKTKKYIRMVMGIYILFSIVSPFIKNKEIFDIDELKIDDKGTIQTVSNIDQTSMNKRIQNLYIQELEKDITKKIKSKGFEVINCKIEANILDDREESKIEKIKLNVKKTKNYDNNKNDKEYKDEKEENLENKLVAEVQKIKPISADIKINSDENKKDGQEDGDYESKITKSDIQSIKKFLIEEYEVSEKCLEIN